MSRRDQRPVADVARRASTRGVHEGDRGVDGDLEGRRQRDADPAVLPTPYDRWEGYAAERDAASPLSAGERPNVVFLDHRHAREPDQRGAATRRSAAAPTAPASGRSSPARSPRTRSRRRSTASSAEGRRTGDSALCSSSRRRRAGWGCAAPPSTRSATREVSVTAKRLTVAMKDAKGRAGARGDRRRLRPARPDRPLTTSGRHADYPHGGRP